MEQEVISGHEYVDDDDEFGDDDIDDDNIICYGDRVQLNKKGYIGSRGQIRFIGIMESKKGIFYGIELDKKIGIYDGSFLNKKYFECDSRKGLFITINDIDKIIKKSKIIPRVTINSKVYVNKYECNGIIKYIGIPFIEKNKSKNLYFGIELTQKKGKNNGYIGKTKYFLCHQNKGIFVKKNAFILYKQITPGHFKENQQKIKQRKPRKQRKKNNKIKNKDRSKSINAKTKKKLKKKIVSKTFSKSRPSSPELTSNSTKIKKKTKINKKFKRNGKKKLTSKSISKSTSKSKPKSSQKVIVSKSSKKNQSENISRRRSRINNDFISKSKSKSKPRTKSATPRINTKNTKNTIKNERESVVFITTPGYDEGNIDVSITPITRTTPTSPDCIPIERSDDNINNETETDDVIIDNAREVKGENDFYDDEENRDYHEEEEEALKLINHTLSIKNYRLFLQCIQGIKNVIIKLDKNGKKRILNHIKLEYHENIMIWQNILHLALFIVKSMHSFYSLDEKKETWDFVDFLLQNGADPLIKMIIKQDNTYQYKNVFRLMSEALKTYKQNEILIIKRFTWLWSLVEDQYKSQKNKENYTVLSDDDDDDDDDDNNDHRIRKPAILTFDANFTNHWIIADAYNQMPSPMILKEYFDFGCDLVHFCDDDSIYYDFDEIRLSLPPNLIITTLRINESMLFHCDLIGRVVLYYKYWTLLRCNDINNTLFTFNIKLPNNIILEIVSYTTTNIIYIDNDKLSEIDLIGYTLCRIPNYSRDWIDFIYKEVICKFDNNTKLKIKELSKKWDNDNEWDYWLANNLKNKQQFLCFIDLFQYVIGYKTAQKITNYYMKANNSMVIEKYMLNENAFKYLELYNILYQYDLTRNESAKYIFQKLIDLVLNKDKNKNKTKLKQNARKELNNLYIQFCRHQVNDWMFKNNFIFILKQLLPSNSHSNSNKNKNKKSKKGYRFDFVGAILHCFKAKQLNTLTFLMDHKLLIDVERALRLFYIDDVIKRIIFGMDEFDENQEDFLKLILNWTWKYAKNKNDMKTWYVKWLNDAQLVEDQDCIQIFMHFANLSNDNIV